jgi:hypothetical protein
MASEKESVVERPFTGLGWRISGHKEERLKESQDILLATYQKTRP